MAGKRSPSIDPRQLVVRDNVPAGMAVSLAGVPAVMSFASMFRDELAARGVGLVKREERGAGKKLV